MAAAGRGVPGAGAERLNDAAAEVAPSESVAPARSLRVLGTSALALRARHRAAARLTVLAAAVVMVAMLVVAGTQAYIAARQVRIDSLEQRLDAAVTTNQSLELARAELSSPDRVLGVAQGRLKMISPGQVQYLAPVNPGPSVAQVAVDPALADSTAGSARGGARR